MKVKELSANANKGFALLAGINRAISPAQVTKLSQSIKKMGIIRPVVVTTIDFIDGVPTTYIVDGQHLYHSLLRLNEDIPYVEIQVSSMEELVEKIALLNASSRSWCLKDYIQSWQSLKPDYVELTRFFNVYDIELSQLSEILHKGFSSSSSNATMTNEIKKGLFTIRNKATAKILLDCLTDVLHIVPRMDRNSTISHIAM